MERELPEHRWHKSREGSSVLTRPLEDGASAMSKPFVLNKLLASGAEKCEYTWTGAGMIVSPIAYWSRKVRRQLRYSARSPFVPVVVVWSCTGNVSACNFRKYEQLCGDLDDEKE
jgi:hypothetical protein